MSVKQPETEIPDSYDIINDNNGLTLHNPSENVVIDIWKRERGTLLETYPYQLSVSKDQETEYERATESYTNAIDAAISWINRH